MKPLSRICTVRDLKDLCKVAESFASESQWKYTYDEDICRVQFFEYISNLQAEVFRVDVDGEIAGLGIVMASQDFSVEIQGFVQKFYILPAFRKTYCARVLSKRMTEWFDMMGCTDSFATSTANLNLQAICLYTNLMKKCGYMECGPTLTRPHPALGRNEQV